MIARSVPPDDWPQRFLAEFCKCGNISHAARKARVTRQGVLARRRNDPEFAAAFSDAQEEATDLLEMEARRRAERGTLEPVFYQGVKCGTVRRYSDALMALLLRANRPDKFRERATIEHSGSVGMVPIREVVVKRPEPDPEPDEQPV